MSLVDTAIVAARLDGFSFLLPSNIEGSLSYNDVPQSSPYNEKVEIDFSCTSLGFGHEFCAAFSEKVNQLLTLFISKTSGDVVYTYNAVKHNFVPSQPVEAGVHYLNENIPICYLIERMSDKVTLSINFRRCATNPTPLAPPA